MIYCMELSVALCTDRECGSNLLVFTCLCCCDPLSLLNWGCTWLSSPLNFLDFSVSMMVLGWHWCAVCLFCSTGRVFYPYGCVLKRTSWYSYFGTILVLNHSFSFWHQHNFYRTSCYWPENFAPIFLCFLVYLWIVCWAIRIYWTWVWSRRYFYGDLWRWRRNIFCITLFRVLGSFFIDLSPSTFCPIRLCFIICTLLQGTAHQLKTSLVIKYVLFRVEGYRPIDYGIPPRQIFLYGEIRGRLKGLGWGVWLLFTWFSRSWRTVRRGGVQIFFWDLGRGEVH